MKRFIVLFSYISLSLSVFSQSSTENYIQTETMLDKNGSNKLTSIQYFDGLGKAIQTVVSGVNQDVNLTNYFITEYDELGRIDKKWLPIIGKNLGFVSSKESEATDTKAYSETKYDAIERPIFISTPGLDMGGRGKKIEYLTSFNVSGKNKVKKYVVNESGTSVLSQNGFYETGELFSEKTTDEDGKTVEIFKNLMGDVVLERKADNNDTYFVYNSWHQLRFVLSPEFQQNGQKAIYGYEYRYDRRGNIIKRILPQCEVIQYWYHSANRLIFMQDANLRERKKYRFYLYDNIGRVVVQGLSSTAKTSGDEVSGIPMASYSSISDGIGNSGYILDMTDLIEKEPIIEVVNYYDNYNFLSGNNKSNFSFSRTPSTSTDVTGYQTGSIVYASNGEYLYDVFFYNNKGLLIAKNTCGLDNYIEMSATNYSFTDNPIKVDYSVEKKGWHYIATNMIHYYDNNSNKVIKTNLNVSSLNYQKNMDISINEYDAYGRLKTVKRNFNNGNIDYSYDLRGWLTKIDTDLFKEEIFYTDNNLNKACYNGNISAIRWKDTGYRHNTNNDMKYRGYKYTYDNINRLQSGIYGENDDLTENSNRYDEIIGEYDSNGNITSLKRRGLKNDKTYGIIDDLKIKYNGNQIQTIRDDAMGLYYENAIDFDGKNYYNANKYNANGSLIQDEARDIALIEYDQWNYPRRIQFTNGNVTQYVYSATGKKLRTINYVAMPSIDVPLGTKRILSSSDILSKDSLDYYENFIMENGKPLSYQFNGGYCSLKDNVTFYFYNQDHLGNNRTVINSTTGKAEQTINYYPFGTPYCDSTSVNPGFQKFKYNGKELDMMHGLNTYDYGARQYYSVVPAWDRIDPLCEKYYSISPYAYCGNNPVNLTDPDGKDPVTGAIIGGAIELGSQLIEKYDVNESVWTNLSQNVNWTGVAIATGEGALTSGVSALKGIGAKMVISAVSSGMKEVSEQVHNGEDVNYVTVAVQSLAGAASTYGVGRYANNKTDIKFKNVKAKPTDKAVMHKRAGQMRYTKSTRRNARNRLRAQKEKNTNKEEAKANAFISVIKALFNRCLSSSL